jgi:hypothetical protein
MEFHVHVDALEISLGVVLMKPREGNLDHLVYSASQKLSQA